MAKGDIVMVKPRSGQPGTRRIWDDAPAAPYVCHEDYWERWERTQTPPVCWQVSRDRIFVADPDLAARLEEAFQALRTGRPQASGELERLWEQAKPYGG